MYDTRVLHQRKEGERSVRLKGITCRPYLNDCGDKTERLTKSGMRYLKLKVEAVMSEKSFLVFSKTNSYYEFISDILLTVYHFVPQ
jgi:hypothetical protein